MKINVQDVIDKGKMNGFFWKVYIICILVVIFDGYDMNIFGPIMPALMADQSLGLNPAQAGFLASYALYGMLIGSLFSGAIADKIGQRKVAMIGILIYSVFTGFAGFATSYAFLAAMRFIAGLGIASVVPSVLAYVASYTPLKPRGALTTWINIGLTFGGMLATGVAITWIQSMGWRFMFYVAFVPLLFIILVHFLLPEPMLIMLRKGNFKKIKETLVKANPAFEPKDDDEYFVNYQKAAKIPYKNLFTDGFARNTILICCVNFIAFYLLFGLSTWIPNLMITKGFALQNSLWMLMTFNSGTILGTTFGAWASPKFGYKKMIAIYYSIAAVLLVILSQDLGVTMQLVVLFFTGATVLGATAQFMSYMAQSYPPTFRSTALGTALAVGRLGGAVGPIIGGVLLNNNASILVCFLAFAIPAAINVILISSTKNFTKRDWQAEQIARDNEEK